jgi:hypothetical protein
LGFVFCKKQNQKQKKPGWLAGPPNHGGLYHHIGQQLISQPLDALAPE